jgi:hypothetical protein
MVSRCAVASLSLPRYKITGLNKLCSTHLAEDEVDLKLTSKVALVTGSTAGIGFAIAKALAREGAHVYVNGRTQQRVDGAMAAGCAGEQCGHFRTQAI